MTEELSLNSSYRESGLTIGRRQKIAFFLYYIFCKFYTTGESLGHFYLLTTRLIYLAFRRDQGPRRCSLHTRHAFTFKPENARCRGPCRDQLCCVWAFQPPTVVGGRLAQKLWACEQYFFWPHFPYSGPEAFDGTCRLAPDSQRSGRRL